MLGVAELGTMCRPFLSYSLSRDGGVPLSLIVATVAHEMGHNFNMNHDDGN